MDERIQHALACDRTVDITAPYRRFADIPQLGIECAHSLPVPGQCDNVSNRAIYQRPNNRWPGVAH